MLDLLFGFHLCFSPIFLLVVFCFVFWEISPTSSSKISFAFFSLPLHHVFNFRELFWFCSLNFFIPFIVHTLFISLRILIMVLLKYVLFFLRGIFLLSCFFSISLLWYLSSMLESLFRCMVISCLFIILR